MVNGMATRKVTITLDEEQLESVKKLVTEQRVASVSGFVQHAVGVALQDVNGWAELLSRSLDETGGPPTAKERAWARSVLRGHRHRAA